MVQDESGALIPFNFGKAIDKIPLLRNLGLKLTVISFPIPIDSSNVGIEEWRDLAYIIEENYAQYEGFVILHGTDTMAYTASALSFMIQGLNKPIILTGAQMPIGLPRSDARENLIAALEIAASTKDRRPMVSEVCVYFNHLLLKGNRAQKIRSSTFAAFGSENYPALAEVGIEIEFNESALQPYDDKAKLKVVGDLNPNISLLRIFPGISKSAIEALITEKSIRGIILESYGSGNTMNFDWFLSLLKKATKEGKIILNVSQCMGGTVLQGKYETSKRLDEVGVLSGRDITTESALAKMMYVLGMDQKGNDLRRLLTTPLVGEMDD